MSAISTVAELIGMALVVYGCGLIGVWLACIVGGLLLVAIGVSISPPVRRSPE